MVVYESYDYLYDSYMTNLQVSLSSGQKYAHYLMRYSSILTYLTFILYCNIAIFQCPYEKSCPWPSNKCSLPLL